MKVVVREGEQCSRDLPWWLCRTGTCFAGDVKATGCVLSGSPPCQRILRPILHSVAVFDDAHSTSDLMDGGGGLCLT